LSLPNSALPTYLCITDDTKRIMLKRTRWSATTPIVAKFSIGRISYTVIARGSESQVPELVTTRSLSRSSNEPGNSGRFSPESSPEASRSSVSVEAPSPIRAADLLQSTPTYHPSHPVSPVREQPTIARYTSNPFRTPQLPRTPRLPSSGFIVSSPPSSSHK
jgi:hypothetical protein